MLTPDHAATLERCMAVGGVAVFPADTVYGLACEPDSKEAVHRLYALKGRAPDKPAAVLFFSQELALEALPGLGPRTQMALEALLPGALTLLLPNPERRFPLACVGNLDTIGVRVPALPPNLAALQAVRWPILQSSANLSGGEDPRTLDAVDASIREGVDLLLDGGELPGTPSTIVDLRDYEQTAEWSIARVGATSRAEVARRLGES